MNSSNMDFFEDNFLLEGGQLMIIGARPSIGKSILIQNIVQNIFLSNNISIGYFSHIRKPLLIEKIFNSTKMIYASGIIFSADDNTDKSIVIDDTPQITMEELKLSTEMMIDEYDVQFLAIDGIENIYIKNTNIDELISNVLPFLKNLAQELDIAIVISIGLNRNCEKRNNKYPVLTDFDNYRAIEQNSNVIVYLYRDEVYSENSDYKGLIHIRFENEDGRNNRVELMTFDGANSYLKPYLHPIYAESDEVT